MGRRRRADGAAGLRRLLPQHLRRASPRADGGADECGFTYGHPYGAFYIFANTARPACPPSTWRAASSSEGDVLVFPGTGFGENWKDYLRFSLLQPTPILLEALDRLRRVLGAA